MQVLCISHTYRFFYIRLLRINKRFGKSSCKSCCVLSSFLLMCFCLLMTYESGKNLLDMGSTRGDHFSIRFGFYQKK